MKNIEANMGGMEGGKRGGVGVGDAFMALVKPLNYKPIM